MTALTAIQALEQLAAVYEQAGIDAAAVALDYVHRSGRLKTLSKVLSEDDASKLLENLRAQGLLKGIDVQAELNKERN